MGREAYPLRLPGPLCGPPPLPTPAPHVVVRGEPRRKPRQWGSQQFLRWHFTFISGVQTNIFFRASGCQGIESSWPEDVRLSAPGHLVPPEPSGQLGHSTGTRCEGTPTLALVSFWFGWFHSGFSEPLCPVPEELGAA